MFVLLANGNVVRRIMYRAINWSGEEVLFTLSTGCFDKTSMFTSTSNPPFLVETHLEDATMMVCLPFHLLPLKTLVISS